MAKSAEENDFEDYETDGLKAKQRDFCHEYLVDRNGTQAAIRAGYSEKTAGVIAYENLRKPQIRSKIQQLMDDRARRTEITADRVLTELAKIAFGDVRNIFDENNCLRSVKDLEADVAAGVQSVEIVTRESGKTEDQPVEYVHKIKLADKKAALDLLGKNLKLFSDKVDLNHSGDVGLIFDLDYGLKEKILDRDEEG